MCVHFKLYLSSSNIILIKRKLKVPNKLELHKFSLWLQLIIFELPTSEKPQSVIPLRFLGVERGGGGGIVTNRRREEDNGIT